MPITVVSAPAESAAASAADLPRGFRQWAETRWGLLAVMIFAIAFFYPTLRVGYNSDDIISSRIVGATKLRGISVREQTGIWVESWMQGGRFFPVHIAILSGVHYCLATHEFGLRAFVLALILVDLALLYRVLRAWRMSPAMAQLGLLSVVLLTQLRDFHDPVLAFAGLFQILVAQLLTAILCWQHFLASRRLAWLLASVVLFVIAVLTYETSYALLPLFLAMAYFHERNWLAALQAIRTHATAAALLIVFVVGLRFHIAHNPDNGYHVHFRMDAIGRTVLNQAGSALPMTYPLASDRGRSSLNVQRWVTRWDNWIAFFAAGAITAAILRQYAKERSGGELAAGLLAVCGLILWILSGVPIAMSPRYQSSIMLGFAYVPIYVQCFGCAMFFLALLHWTANRLSGRARLGAAVAFVALNACVAMVHYDSNREVARRFTRDDETVARRQVETALRMGLADAIPADATVWFPTAHAFLNGAPFVAGSHLTLWLDRRINAVAGPASSGWLADPNRFANIPLPTFAMRDGWHDGRSGYVALCEIEGTPTATGGEILYTRKVRVFVRGSFAELAGKGGRLKITAAGGSPGEADSVIDFSLLSPVRQESDGAIYEGCFDLPVNVASLVVSQTDRVAERSSIVR